MARSAAAEEIEEAEACLEEPSPTNTEDAKGAFRAGQTAFSEGAYGPAVELWGQAYRDDCTAHGILLNLATAHELLGRPEEAIHALRRFNRRAPGSPYFEANVKRIQRLERTSIERARQRARRDRAPMRVEPPRAAMASSTAWALPLPLVVAVAGGTLAVAGGVLYAEARVASADAADRCGPTVTCSSLESVVDGERARSRAEIAGWLTGAGLATAATGVLWHLFVDDPQPMDRAGVSGGARPQVSLQGAALYWNGRF